TGPTRTPLPLRSWAARGGAVRGSQRPKGTGPLAPSTPSPLAANSARPRAGPASLLPHRTQDQLCAGNRRVVPLSILCLPGRPTVSACPVPGHRLAQPVSGFLHLARVLVVVQGLVDRSACSLSSYSSSSRRTPRPYRT